MKINYSSMFDKYNAAICDKDCVGAVANLSCDLKNLRSTFSDEEWKTVIIPTSRKHDIHKLLQEDPFTKRAFYKPRGYAGDAVMLDYLYKGEPPQNTSIIGRNIFRATTNGSNGRSVLNRRKILGQNLDEVARRNPGSRILSIACGHLREVQLSEAFADGLIDEIVAFDQDQKCLDFIQSDFQDSKVKTIRKSIVAILTKQVIFRNFDFVYAAGLFDYLSDEIARRLLKIMMNMLRPEGKLLITNFTPDNYERGYMECFMDWFAICRTDEQMLSLIDDIPYDNIADQAIYRDEEQNIVYLELTKK